MKAESVTVGLQRVDAHFCRRAFPASAGEHQNPIDLDFVVGDTPTLTCKWETAVRLAPVLLAMAKVNIALPSIADRQVDAIDHERTKASLKLLFPPMVVLGTRTWAVASGRRMSQKQSGRATWLGDEPSGNAAMPPLLRNGLAHATSMEVVIRQRYAKARLLVICLFVHQRLALMLRGLVSLD